MKPNEDLDILLIEDDPNDAEMIMRALKKRGIENNLIHVEDGAAAAELLFGADSAHPKPGLPRLIILDLSMPKIDGADVLETIKTSERTRGIPVVVLTSSREESDLKRCYELGVNSYIVKPVDFMEFSNTISNIGHYWLELNLTPN